MTALDLRVDEVQSGTRLDKWVAGASGRPRAEVQRLIESGLVRVDGRLPKKSVRVESGQVISIAEEEPAAARVPESFEVPLRFEDEHLAVVAKPPGLVVHPAPGGASTTLVDVLSARMPLAPAAGEHRPGIVHRLDKTTSGLLVVAKTDEAYHGLIAAMKQREIKRTYRALVVGGFSMPTGRIEAPVGRSAKRPTVMSVTPAGKDAITEFDVLEPIGEVTLLSVRLLTGRTHQIRVHLAHIHRPVVGDLQYGSGAQQLPQVLGLVRPFLHAFRLEFEHPVTGRWIAIEEPLPQDLVEALGRARARVGDG